MRQVTEANGPVPCWRSPPSTMRPAVRASRLLDVPHEDGGGADIALEVPAQRGLRLELSGRNIGDDLKRTLLDLRGDFLALLGILGFQPLGAQLFELVVAGPAEPGLLAISAQHDVDRGIERVGTDPAGLEHVPPPLGDRLFRGP